MSTLLHVILDRAPALTSLAQECKGCPGTLCKGCHGTEHAPAVQASTARPGLRLSSLALNERWGFAPPDSRGRLSLRGIQFRKYCRYNVSRCAGRKPASRMMRRNSSSVVQLFTPAARTTFSSSITEPTSLPPKRKPIWQTFNPCVTQLDCTFRKFER